MGHSKSAVWVKIASAPTACVNKAFDSADTVADDAGIDRQARANLMCELYVILGALDAPAAVLDQSMAAVEGEELPYSTLLPFEND